MTRRTGIVWGSFVLAMTSVVGLLQVLDGADPTERPSGFLMTNVATHGGSSDRDPVFSLEETLDRARWSGIVIHHSNEAAGDAESMTALHESYGYKGLGYHFLIGNGNGLGDGVVHVGYRWLDQLPGVHTAGEQGDHHNRHSIGICLVGNGDRRAFTERQIENLISLIQRLQRTLEIPADRVFLHRDLAEGVTAPGTFFAAGRVQEQLLDLPR